MFGITSLHINERKRRGASDTFGLNEDVSLADLPPLHERYRCPDIVLTLDCHFAEQAAVAKLALQSLLAPHI
jgi:hypothetical protein